MSLLRLASKRVQGRHDMPGRILLLVRQRSAGRVGGAFLILLYAVFVAVQVASTG